MIKNDLMRQNGLCPGGTTINKLNPCKSITYEGFFICRSK